MDARTETKMAIKSVKKDMTQTVKAAQKAMAKAVKAMGKAVAAISDKKWTLAGNALSDLADQADCALTHLDGIETYECELEELQSDLTQE